MAPEPLLSLGAKWFFWLWRLCDIRLGSADFFMLIDGTFFRNEVVRFFYWLRFYLFSAFHDYFLGGDALFIFQAPTIEFFPQFELFGAIGAHDVSHIVHHIEVLVDLHPYLLTLACEEPVLVDDRTLHQQLFVGHKAWRIEPSGKLHNIFLEPVVSPRLTSPKQPLRVATPGTAAGSCVPLEIPIQTFAVLAFHKP